MNIINFKKIDWIYVGIYSCLDVYLIINYIIFCKGLNEILDWVKLSDNMSGKLCKEYNI